MKKLYTCILMLGYCVLSAQEVKWQKNIPSHTQDFLVSTATTVDGQFLIAGSSIRNGENGYDYHIIKLSQQGDRLWEKYFSGNRHDYLGNALALKDGGFVLGGSSYSTAGQDKKDKSFGGSDLWIIRLDENGDEMWQKTFGSSLNEEVQSSAEGMDGSILIAANTQNNNYGFGSKDVWLVKLDSKGNKLSEAYLGGKGIDEAEKIIPTSDGGFLVAINSRSGKSDIKDFVPSGKNDDPNKAPVLINKDSENFGENDFWIVKLDKNLNQQWQKTLGGNGDDKIKNIALTDSGYIIGGESRSQTSGNKKAKLEEGTDLWLVSLDENGQENWQKSYSFKNRDLLMSLNVINHNDGQNQKTKGFLIGGYTQAEAKLQKNDETFWMLYLDSKGEEVWRKYVEGKEKKNEERLVSATLNRDGSYLIAGMSAEELGEENWKIVKLEDRQVKDLIENKDIQIYPNPVKDYCYVEIDFDFDQADIYLYDMTGKIIQQLQTKNKVTKVNTSKLPQGIYLVKASVPTHQNKNLTTKIVKE